MKATDVIIAGAGLMGLTSAYYLARQGLSVRVLEAGRIGREASWAGGGILWPLYAWRYPEAVQNLAQRGREIYPQLCEALLEQTGIDPEYRECGLMLLDEFEPARQWCASYDEPIAEASASETSTGLLLPKVAQVRNPRLCKALAASLAMDGVALHEFEPVDSLVINNGRFQGMRSGKTFYPAGIGIVAAGAWSSQLLPDIDIFPVKGQMLLLRGAPGQLEHILLSCGRYVIPRADGHILVGSTVENTGFETGVEATAAIQLKSFFDELLPLHTELPIVRKWAGLRPATHSGIPFVGELPEVSGLFVNAGHYRNGLVTAPASACLVTQLIAGSAPCEPGKTVLSAGDYSAQQ